MYVPYRCCQKSFEDHYVNQIGEGLNYYQGGTLQRGYGFGGLFRSFLRFATPLFKSGAKTLGKQLLHTGLDVANDVAQGQDFKLAAKQRLKQAGKQLTDKASNKIKTMIGSGKRGIKRKAAPRKIIRRKVKKEETHDIFS